MRYRFRELVVALRRGRELGCAVQRFYDYGGLAGATAVVEGAVEFTDRISVAEMLKGASAGPSSLLFNLRFDPDAEFASNVRLAGLRQW